MFGNLQQVEDDTQGNVLILTRDWGSPWTPGTPGSPGFYAVSDNSGVTITSATINTDSRATLVFDVAEGEPFGVITFYDDTDGDSYEVAIYPPQSRKLTLSPLPLQLDDEKPINWQHPLSRGLIVSLYGRRNLLGDVMPTLVGNATWVTDAAMGHAIALDGSGDYIVISNQPKFAGMSQLTFHSWIYKGNKDIKPWGKSQSGTTHLFAERSGVFLVGLNSTSGYTSLGGLPGWHAYGFVYDGSKITVYRDGIQDPTTVSVSGSIGATTGNLIFGAEYDATDAQDGKFGFTNMWNVALSPVQMSQLSNTASRYGMLNLRQPSRRFMPAAGSGSETQTLHRRVTTFNRAGSRSVFSC